MHVCINEHNNYAGMGRGGMCMPTCTFPSCMGGGHGGREDGADSIYIVHVFTFVSVGTWNLESRRILESYIIHATIQHTKPLPWHSDQI